VEHFQTAPLFAGLQAGLGLNGYSWPDLDMLPLGMLGGTPCNLTSAPVAVVS
jgi:hypothetical protein